ncbi:hypothetical protein BH10BAC2_BH10BAC2_08500 [soil metagenome]
MYMAISLPYIMTQCMMENVGGILYALEHIISFKEAAV